MMVTLQDFRPEFIVYGDMGRHGGSFILPHLREEVKKPEITAIIHVGDFAYDFNSDGGVVKERHLFSPVDFSVLGFILEWGRVYESNSRRGFCATIHDCSWESR